MIPLLRPEIPDASAWLPYLQESRRLHQFSNYGPCVNQAIDRLRNRLGRYTLPVNNGTTALQLALQATLPTGSTVAVPDFTFIASLNAIISAGMIPIMFPSSPRTWTMCIETLWRESARFDALLVVSPFGYRTEFASYDQFSLETGKPVVYDCAAGFDFESYTTNPVCYSLHATKNLPVGEGGLIAFSSEAHWARAKRLTNFDMDERRDPLTPNGTNCKMDEVHAAILLAQLDREEHILKRIAARKHLLIQYQNDLGSIVEPHDMYVGGAPQLCVVRTKFAETLAELGPSMGVQFRRYYYPLLTRSKFSAQIQSVGRSPEYFEKFLALPSDPIGEEYGKVIETIRALTKAPRKGNH